MLPCIVWHCPRQYRDNRRVRWCGMPSFAGRHVVGAADWPDVDWPMAIMSNSSNGTYPDRDRWTGEGDWGQYWLGVGGTCADRSPPAGSTLPWHALSLIGLGVCH